MAQAKVTTDHDEIRKWTEARGGRPAAVRSTQSKDATGIIRIEFPGAPNAKDDNLEEITWDEFFEKFDESDLALLYQEETASGQRSNFSTNWSAVKPPKPASTAKATPAILAAGGKPHLYPSRDPLTPVSPLE